MTRRHLILTAMLGSLGLLIGAWIFQSLGYAPCKMCIWQRYPHGVAVAVGALALLFPLAILAVLGALAAFSTGAIGIYHTGVERGWWEGPSSCSSGDISGLSNDDLFQTIMNAPLVRCDEVAWQLFGISMASWNALFSFALVVIWIMAYRKSGA